MLNRIREVLIKENLEGFLINSTNEFLVEYNLLEENARYALTGFSGSTGDAVVTKDKVYLFVDGRYHIQADDEVNSLIVTVVKLQTGDTFLNKLKEFLPKKSRFGIIPQKNSQYRIEELQKHFNVVYCEEDFYSPKLFHTNENIEKVDISLCGLSDEDKLNILRRYFSGDDAVLVTDAEAVSYLFNLRDFSMPYSSKILRRAIITKNLAKLYSRKDYEEYKKDLLNVKGRVFVDKKSVNGRDYELVKDKAAYFEENIIADMKAHKTEVELEHYRDCFRRTDMAVRAIRDYILDNDNISEYDIDVQLEKEFKRYGAKCLSFKSIVAKDKNSALAHYSKSSKEEIIKDGSLVLIDCGAYYEGGLATDITRVFVKGEPDNLQKKVYTTVLKAFLNAYNTDIAPGVCGYDIDKKTREFLKKNLIDGFEFNHGLGHGIGISVHEYPPNLSANELAKVKLEDSMCFTIEPGLYNKDCFGIRLENSCYLKDGKIRSFVHMNYEKKLIDFRLLSEREKEWLKEFEVL